MADIEIFADSNDIDIILLQETYWDDTIHSPV